MSGTNDQPDAEDVVAATEFVARVLESRDLAAAGMSGRAGSLRWTCAKTLAHISDAVSWYAANLARRSTTSSEMPYLSVRTKPPFMIDCLRSAGALLAAAVRDAAADARGFHSWGRPDRSGFAAMGCDEVLIHGWDLAQGLALEFSPPEQPVERTLRRLFPWAPGRDEAGGAPVHFGGRKARLVKCRAEAEPGRSGSEPCRHQRRRDSADRQNRDRGREHGAQRPQHRRAGAL
ncbi:MAG: hypothetical protein KY395_01340, partial [Actinobacteria bacterium]|nr:hypothetical protein [Actinomycetota bacterium]